MKTLVILGVASLATPAHADSVETLWRDMNVGGCMVIARADRPVTVIHEMAHCNGWKHAPGVTGLPPEEFMGKVYRPLVLLNTEGNGDRNFLTMRGVQEGDFVDSYDTDMPAGVACKRVWAEADIPDDTGAYYGTSAISGCAIVKNQ